MSETSKRQACPDLPPHASKSNNQDGLNLEEYSRISTYRQIAILTDGCSHPSMAKTAISLLRYRMSDVVAVVDTAQAGQTAQQVFGVGGAIPIVGKLSEVPGADSLFLGIAPAGGRLPPEWRSTILQAIHRRWDIVSGLHEFLQDDAEFNSTAQATGCELIDVRRNHQHTIASAAEFQPDCLRVLTVGQDCSVGKMTVSLEIERSLQALGHDAFFLPTGQTGIMIRGHGVPIDCVVADFVNGAIEQSVLRHQNHSIVLIEGQGSISHPSFSGVTMGLLHGCAPQGMVLCYEAGRDTLKGFPHVPACSLNTLKQLYETNASVRYPSEVIGIAMNSRQLSSHEADAEQRLVESEMGLPVCDVFRHGPKVLVDATLALKAQIEAQCKSVPRR